LGLPERDCHQALSFAIAAFMSCLRWIDSTDIAGIPERPSRRLYGQIVRGRGRCLAVPLWKRTATCEREQSVAATFVPSTRTSKTLVVPGTPGLLR
jgi:hypothetical protein